jgi:hypothetical protein
MDLICIKDACDYHSDVLYVQCKVRKELMSPKEKEELKIHSGTYGAQAVLAYKDKKGHIVTETLQFSPHSKRYKSI